MSTRKLGVWVAVVTLAIVACHKVPQTGRLQYDLIPESIMRGIGRSSYVSMLSEARVVPGGNDRETLVKVGDRIARVTRKRDYNWEFSLVDDPMVNAWCLPGGYIAFYTGILPVLRDEAGMAFVMGHEVGHAVAHHAAERLSQQLTVVGGLTVLKMYLANETPLDPQTRQLILATLGLGAEVGLLLPFSRIQESEADVIGMMFAARAGYPPSESIALWDRMDRLVGEPSVPAFLADHPPNDQRRANLREWMPQADKKYERNKLPYDTRVPLWTALPSEAATDGVTRPTHPSER